MPGLRHIAPAATLLAAYMPGLRQNPAAATLLAPVMVFSTSKPSIENRLALLGHNEATSVSDSLGTELPLSLSTKRLVCPSPTLRLPTHASGPPKVRNPLAASANVVARAICSSSVKVLASSSNFLPRAAITDAEISVTPET